MDELILRGVVHLRGEVERVVKRMDQQDGRLMVLEAATYWRVSLFGLLGGVLGALAGAAMVWLVLHVP